MKELFKLMTEIGAVGADTEINLDYSGAKFTHPFFTLPLLLLIRNKNQNEGFSIKIDNQFFNHSVASYMESISFPNMLTCDNKPLEEIESILESYSQKTYIPLINFPIGDDPHTNVVRDKFISHLNRLIRNIVEMDQINALYYMIDELISNIVHHAGRDKGYILAQNFPTKGYVDICIGDIGRTLLESYQQFENNRYGITTHSEAMHAALSGKSTKGGIDRGYGISTSTKMLCEGMNGRFFMFSGNSFTYINAHERDITEIKIPKVYWEGVLICMRIPHKTGTEFNYIDYTE